jgi:hypothetical protein
LNEEKWVVDMNNVLPNAKSGCSPKEREKLIQIIAQRGLCGLANDTKWNELIDAMRARSEWLPRYRFKCIDGRPCGWDVEWYYHLPFPMLSVEWFDVLFLQDLRNHRLPPLTEVIDHSGWIEELIRRIGLDYRKGSKMIRIFGYSPRGMELFDE